MHTTTLMRSKLFYLLFVILALRPSYAEVVRVRYHEGVTHGFLVSRTPEGVRIGFGDLVQTVQKDIVTTRLEIHFNDGSLHQETAVFSQRGTFHLLSDHLIEKGPTFDSPIEVSIDALKGQVTVRDMKDGKDKTSIHHVDLPADLANGMIFILVKNFPQAAQQMTVSVLAATPKPRVVKLTISRQGEDTFSMEGSKRKAMRYLAKVEIGGVAGVIAPLIGKKPPDAQIWVLQGEAPTFLKTEGPLGASTPVWRTELTSPVWAQSP
ncbi:MAG TPA: hypothetical protein VH079_07575 [Terriglobales bacterium]|nr:hypothetical protein [Terriglobales bacterium]